MRGGCRFGTLFFPFKDRPEEGQPSMGLSYAKKILPPNMFKYV